LKAILRTYDSKAASFGAARDALRQLIAEVAELKYVRP
jgi:hypothetical protein